MATSANRVAMLLRLAAISVGRTSTALGAFFRRLAVRAAYVDPGSPYYEERYRQRAINNLRRRADALGLSLVEPAVASSVGAS